VCECPITIRSELLGMLLLLLLPFLATNVVSDSRRLTHETGTSGGVNFNYLTGMPEALARPPEPGSSLPNFRTVDSLLFKKYLLFFVV
jgi:hypothetical protein